MAFRIHIKLMYLGGESNPYLKIRNFPFYPLNYQGGVSGAKLGNLIGICNSWEWAGSEFDCEAGEVVGVSAEGESASVFVEDFADKEEADAVAVGFG